MEKLKVKHDHKLTDILKVCMFSLFLILPILMFLPNALYYGCNKYASQERQITEGGYEIVDKYQTNEVNDIDDLVIGNLYHFSLPEDVISDYISNVDNLRFTIVNCTSYSFGNYLLEDTASYTNGSGTPYLELYISNRCETYVYVNFLSQEYFASIYVGRWDTNAFTFVGDVILTEKDCDFDNISFLSASDYNEKTVIYNDEVTKTLDIAESLAYSWQETWEQPMFNWTSNNNFSFTINAFTNVFGISEESYIANYLCYIMTLIVIYIIYDIIIVLFTKMTHLFNE